MARFTVGDSVRHYSVSHGWQFGRVEGVAVEAAGNGSEYLVVRFPDWRDRAQGLAPGVSVGERWMRGVWAGLFERCKDDV